MYVCMFVCVCVCVCVFIYIYIYINLLEHSHDRTFPVAAKILKSHFCDVVQLSNIN